ncbi:GUN4 domain-containing protein [Trichocoleus sp. FACHB-262]|uniref:GUN4 domain-containing protein n=1 Tax=Trichocoleus sp. FACHB-262 TaxID=2692869 RepID=UPI0016882A17|nr:GUN4 domain-containing protein [Trichocoleus sp. FACHB-262]MBD2124751.1 GUN4 domain-containing protein [Trichocoleus sp. FACHB-262]
MSAEAQVPTKVFISYSWDSETHKERVLMLANTLRNPWGIEADIDQYVRAKPPYTPGQGWDLWMEKRIEWAEFVLIVCTETYKRRFRGDEEPGFGRGVTWEGTIIRQNLYNDQLRNTKFIPVVFSSQNLVHVPIILTGNDKYVLQDEKSFRELCYRLRKEPIVAMPDVASAKLPAPPEPKFFSPQNPSTEPPPVRLDVPEIQDPNATSKGQKTTEQPPLDTPRGDYTYLEDLLKAGRWKEADQETDERMCEVMRRQRAGWLRSEDLEQFPCADLREIDRLWLKHSNGRFGFSVQKEIWQKCDSPEGYYQRKEWKRFAEEVGWKKMGVLGIGGDWKSRDEHTFSLKAPPGHLPLVPVSLWMAIGWGMMTRGVWRLGKFFSRVQTCKL